MAKVKPPIERIGTMFRINLDVEERQLIQRLMGELRTLLQESGLQESGDADQRLRRLFPAAYHATADKDKDDEYQRLMHEELLTSRLKGLDIVEMFLHEAGSRQERLTEGQMSAFLQALNAVRLVLGTLLDISEDHDPSEMDDDHPLVGEYQLYNFLSWVLDWTVRALQG